MVKDIESVAHEMGDVMANLERRKVVPLTADERQMLARLTMWRKRLREAADQLAAPADAELIARALRLLDRLPAGVVEAILALPQHQEPQP